MLAYVLPGMPAAALGAYTLVHLPDGWPEMLLGLFIIALVPLRRLATAKLDSIGLVQVALAGAVVGFLTGIFLSTGPLCVPAFLAYGLVGGAFIATEAAASLLVQASKILSFRELGVLSADGVLKGFIVDITLMLGTFAARPLVGRISDNHFRSMMDAVTGLSGLWLFVFGLRQFLHVAVG